MYLSNSFSEQEFIKEFKIGETTNNIIYPVGNQPYIIDVMNVLIDGTGDKLPANKTAIIMQTIHQNDIWNKRFANDLILNLIPKYPDIKIKQCVQTMLRLFNSRLVIVSTKFTFSVLMLVCTPLLRVGM